MKRRTKALNLVLAVTLTFCVTFSQVLPTMAADGKRAFTDVRMGSWYNDHVYKLMEKDIVKGFGNGTFLPEKQVTRAEFLKMLEGVAKLAPVEAKDVPVNFKDIEGWYKDVVKWAIKTGIATGYSEENFEPNLTVTRGEAATFISRYLKAQGKVANNAQNKAFSDVDKFPSWAAENIKDCVAWGIINGYPDNSFKADKNLTRGEAAYMLSKCYDTVSDMGNTGKIEVEPKNSDKNSESEKIEKGNKANKADNDTNFSDKFAASIAKVEKGNFLISPYSAKLALAMAANGGKGETKKEVLDTLGIKDIDKFNNQVKLQKEIYSKAAAAMTLDVNNSLWINKTQMPENKFKDKFEKISKEYYSADVGIVTIDNALQKVNGWIGEKTRGKIKNCLDSPDFSTALVNTVYFKGAWQDSFEENATKKDDFHESDGKVVKTDFMNQVGEFEYFSDGNVKILKMPYDNHSYKKGQHGEDRVDKIFPDIALSMYVAISEKGEFLDMEKLINSSNFKYSRVKISLPKFEFEYKNNLNKILKSLGINRAFTNGADFSEMMEESQAIGNVIQNAYIAVDEEGTEASAATVIAMVRSTAVLDQPILFKADKPFQFAIYDEKAGEVLFTGRYSKVGK